MAKFQWEAATRAGEPRKGVMEAANAEAVEARLKGEGLSIKKVKRERRDIQIQIGTGVGPKICKFSRGS